MKHLLFSTSVALMRPEAFAAAAERLPDTIPQSRRAAKDDDEDEDGDGADQPWWMKEDIYGDPLPAPGVTKDGTMIIPVKGVLVSGFPRCARAFGFEDTGVLTAWVRAAAADDAIKRVVFSIDSPGGMVTGIPELGAEVDRLSQTKETIAHTAGMMDSAAYWIGSQTTAVYCTPSADVGCIGVYQVSVEYSQMLKERGIKATMFKSGDLKAAGHPAFPLSKDQAAHIQAQIDLIGVQFRAAVKSKRTMVDDDSMRGQSFLGSEAVERKLAGGLRSLESLL